MIFVTVGNAKQPFSRLIRAVADLRVGGDLPDLPVLVQSGHTPPVPAPGLQYEAFLPLDRFTGVVREADVVISHAGAGTLIHLFQAGRVPIVMARRASEGEHVDDHQVELANALAEEGRVLVVGGRSELLTAFHRVRAAGTRGTRPAGSRMLDLVRSDLEAFSARRSRN